MRIVGPWVNLDRAMRGSGCLVLAAWLASGEAQADSHCISSELYCDQVIVSSAPSLSVGCPSPDSLGSGFVSYDIPAGTLQARASSSGGFSAAATMNDSFRVVGPPDGTPLDFTAQLVLVGLVVTRYCGCCYGAVRARILEGSSNEAQTGLSPGCGTENVDLTLELPVHRSAGERFRISAYVYAAGVEGGSGAIYGTLRFSSLPEGASVVSCNGFQQGSAVPVAGATWGRLKIRYR